MNNDSLFLAIDQGGGSTRAIVFDGYSNIVAKASQSVSVEHPRLGWVEQDAENIFESAVSVLKKIETLLGEDVTKIVAAGLATQRSNVVCWRRNSGAALSAALSWQDRRAYQWMDQFDQDQRLIREKTGLVVSPH